MGPQRDQRPDPPPGLPPCPAGRSRTTAERWRSHLLWWARLALAVLLWHLAAQGRPEYSLPGPAATWRAPEGLVADEELGTAVRLTVSRSATGLAISASSACRWAGRWEPGCGFASCWTPGSRCSWRCRRWWTVGHVVLPAVAPPVVSAMTVDVGQSVRLTVMAGLLSTTTGLGSEAQQARTNLETADVFALAVVMAALTLTLELCVLKPLRRRMARPF